MEFQKNINGTVRFHTLLLTTIDRYKKNLIWTFSTKQQFMLKESNKLIIQDNHGQKDELINIISASGSI